MTALFLVLLVALAYLRHLGDLLLFEIIGVLVLLFMIAILVAALPERLRCWLNWLERALDRLSSRFGRPHLWSAGWSECWRR